MLHFSFLVMGLALIIDCVVDAVVDWWIGCRPAWYMGRWICAGTWSMARLALWFGRRLPILRALDDGIWIGSR
jgi:hypothetical protein